MALPTVVNTGSNVTSAAAPNIDLPSGIAAGDMILLLVEHGDQAVGRPTPSGTTGITGWVELGPTLIQGGAFLTVWYTYARVALSTGTNGTVSDSGDHTQARTIVLRHAEGQPIVHGYLDSTDASSDTSGDATGFTTTVDDCLIVICATGDLPDLSLTTEFSGETNANLGSLTERMDNAVTTGNGGAKGMWTGTLAAKGAIGNTTYTKANAAVKCHRVIAIAPPNAGSQGAVYDLHPGTADLFSGRRAAPKIFGAFERFFVAKMHAVYEAAGGGITYEKAGELTAGTSLAGTDVAEFVETAALLTAARAAGADVAESAETGALVAGTRLSGADVAESVEAGALVAGTTLSGADVAEHVETAALVAGTTLSGADVSEFVEAGALATQAIFSGVAVKVGAGGTTYEKTGALAAGTAAAAADVAEHVETGALTSTVRTAGADAYEAVETATLRAGTALSGADTYTAVETGAIVTRTALSGVAEGQVVYVVGFFDQPTLNVTVDIGTPTAAAFDQPTPDGDLDEPALVGAFFDSPNPRQT